MKRHFGYRFLGETAEYQDLGPFGAACILQTKPDLLGPDISPEEVLEGFTWCQGLYSLSPHPQGR